MEIDNIVIEGETQKECYQEIGELVRDYLMCRSVGLMPCVTRLRLVGNYPQGEMNVTLEVHVYDK